MFKPLALAAIIAIGVSDAFTAPGNSVPLLSNKNFIKTRPSSFALNANVVDLDDEVIKEGDGTSTRIRVKGIDREWDGGKGSMEVDVFLPENNTKPKGCAFFMHGFSQYPKAYRKTLLKVAADANVAVLAVRTGVTDKQVLSDNKDKIGKGKGDAQYCLQRAVSQDTMQLIDMIKKGSDELKIKVGKGTPLGLMGHSMGGGLCFYVAEQKQIDYVACMAPAVGVESFDPYTAVNAFTPKHSLLIAGTWDIIAPLKAIKKIFTDANANKPNSSILAKIARGLHTGFEDDLVIFDIKLTSLGGIAALLFPFIGFGEFLIILLLKVIRQNTGQLEGSQDLLINFFTAMATKKPITVDSVKESFEASSGDERWSKKFSFE